ncbi:MAG: YbaB/EbfC family nucleoid-associated protein [Gammaproteobacteria bacterium]|nr:YbaB/EbfC family nucleoid-associated protein [Gammaproteobacteria bacterium]
MADTPDLKELMRMAQEMQQSMKEAHDDLSRQEYKGEAGGGLVTVYMNGRHDTKRVIFDPKVKSEDLEFLADLVAAANNAATREIEKASEKKMFDLTKKLGIPGAQDKEEE